MLQGFKDFLFRGNIVDLAVAVVIGTAFTALVTSFSDAIIQPILNSLGGSDIGDGLGFALRSGNPKTFIDLGLVISAIITFVITAAVVYFVFVVPSKKLTERMAPAAEEAAAEEAEELVLLREIRDALARPTGYRAAEGNPPQV